MSGQIQTEQKETNKQKKTGTIFSLGIQCRDRALYQTCQGRSKPTNSVPPIPVYLM